MITLKIPSNPIHLRNAASMLNKIADQLEEKSLTDQQLFDGLRKKLSPSILSDNADVVSETSAPSPDDVAINLRSVEIPGALAPEMGVKGAVTVPTPPAAVVFATNPFTQDITPVVLPQAGLAVPPEAYAPPVASSEVVPQFTRAPASVELDVDGLPWDSRIHASRKAKNSDGRWRQKRGVDPVYADTVGKELHAVMSAPAAAPVPAAAPSVVIPPPPRANIDGVVPVSAPAAAPDGKMLFAHLIRKVTAAIAEGKLTNEKVTDVVKRHGVPVLPLLINRPDLVPAVTADIDALIGG